MTITQIKNFFKQKSSPKINAIHASRITNRGTTEERYKSFIEDIYRCIKSEAKIGNNYFTTKIPEEFFSQDCESQFVEDGFFTHITTYKTTKIMTIIW